MIAQKAGTINLLGILLGGNFAEKDLCFFIAVFARMRIKLLVWRFECYEEEQFRHWKANSENQMLQLKKESWKCEFERHKLLALYQRQTQVLQRKIEETARATKKAKRVA
ncbi:hypothetical protein Ccrd_026008 [Cynara cardunculus var. scolymus]|uniref:Uncharacterized protein n=1 Tax=Cynara cardunculus var. scolymus TaxID=59895 RepID=A0A103T1T3_CYNCS|nr:hypothetical protein Ccrd_026008 [Cynara cardunculus var. scolymus]